MKNARRGEAESKSKGGSHVHRCVLIQVPMSQPARVSRPQELWFSRVMDWPFWYRVQRCLIINFIDKCTMENTGWYVIEPGRQTSRKFLHVHKWRTLQSVTQYCRQVLRLLWPAFSKIRHFDTMRDKIRCNISSKIFSTLPRPFYTHLCLSKAQYDPIGKLYGNHNIYRE